MIDENDLSNDKYLMIDKVRSHVLKADWELFNEKLEKETVRKIDEV